MRPGKKKGRRRTKSRPVSGHHRDSPFILLALERAPWSVLPPPNALPAPVGAFFSTVVHPSSTIVADRSTCGYFCAKFLGHRPEPPKRAAFRDCRRCFARN